MASFGFSAYGSEEYGGGQEGPIRLISAVPIDPVHLVVEFDQLLDFDAVLTDPSSFEVDGGLEVKAVELATPTSVILTVGPLMAPEQLYTLTAVGAIRDFINHDTIDDAFRTAQFLGFRVGATTPFTYDLYKFFIKPIRDDDTRLGTELLKRLLKGAQLDWDRTYAAIKSMLKLSSYLDCPKEYLQDLLQLLGFTGDTATANITDDLSELDQRRLLFAAVKIWKTKGTELSYEKISHLLGGIRIEIDDWFYFRWIVFGDPTDVELDGVIGEDRVQGDSWIVSSPGEVVEPDEYQSDIVIMDEPDLELNRDLVISLLKLARPSSERLDVCFVEYLDHYDDDSSVEKVSGASVISGGKLAHAADDTLTVSSVAYSEYWTDTYAAWQVLVNHQVRSDSLNKFRLVFHYSDEDNYDYLEVDLGAGTGTAAVSLGRRVSGAESMLMEAPDRVSLDVGYDYVWRVQALRYKVPGTATVRQQVRVLQDQDQVMLYDEATGPTVLTSGKVGERSFKAWVTVTWKEVFQAPIKVVRVRPALRVEPHYESVPPFGQQQFAALGGGGGYHFSLLSSESGAYVSHDGAYMAGMTPGVDRILVRDQFNIEATAMVEVKA
jgi:hypothetical protein